jgi:hypothetical protein
MYRYKKIVVFTLSLLLSQSAFAGSIMIINNNTPAYYNNSLGMLLNGTSKAFPISDDFKLSFVSPPDLTPVKSKLGNWLNNPPVFSIFWTATPVKIPKTWALGSETAITYPIYVPQTGYIDVLMRFGVDNGIFVWLDGRYLGGYMNGGYDAHVGEYTFRVDALSAGVHYLQVLREDHGVADDYNVEVTANRNRPIVKGVVSWAKLPYSVQCINRTTAKGVSILRNKTAAYDCEKAGLVVKSGDDVTVRIRGKKY